MSKIDLIIDMESLGQGIDSVILSIGVVAFDAATELERVKTVGIDQAFYELVNKGFHIKLDVEDQVKTYKRKIDTGTINWWKAQGPEARHVLARTPEDKTIPEVKDAFVEYLTKVGYAGYNSWSKRGHVWTRGMIDGFWLQSLFRDIDVNCDGKQFPIHWGSFRDVRTFIDMKAQVNNGYLPDVLKFPEPMGFVKHNAMHDVAFDLLQMMCAVDPFAFGKDDIPF